MQSHARTSPQAGPPRNARKARRRRARVPAHPVDEKRMGDLSQDGEGQSGKTRQTTSGLQKRFVAPLRQLRAG
jgi:hypothetical protein